MQCLISKRKRRQYNLVYRIRKKGYKVDTKGKTIYCDGIFLELFNKLQNEYNFYIQLELTFI